MTQRPEKSVAHHRGELSGAERNCTRAEGTTMPFSSTTATCNLCDERGSGAGAEERMRSCARDADDRASTAASAADRVGLGKKNMASDRLDTVSRFGGCWPERKALTKDDFQRTIYDGD
jgi:hypothetical protein